MKGFFTFILAVIYFPASAQTFKWAQAIHNSKSDKVNAVRVSDSGYIFVAGYFGNNITLGTNNLTLSWTGSSSSKEAFVAKFDSTGYCYWAKSGGNLFDDRVLGMDVDKEGCVIITGTFWNSGAKFPPLTLNGSGGGDQCFVVKYDPNGNVLWGTTVANSGYGDDQGSDLAVDAAGNVYVVGFMSRNLLHVGGTSVTASNNNGTTYYKHSYWIAKFDKQGVPKWAHCFGNLPYDTAQGKYLERDIAVCTDNKDGIYVTGGFDHTFPFGNTTLTSSGGYDIFVMKYDSAGTFKWAKNGGSRKNDWANGICSDYQGHIYVVGEHRDSLIYDTTLVKNFNGRDAFILKINADDGTSIWGRRAGSNFGSERGNDVKADSACNVYFCGDIWQGSQFGDNLTTPNSGKLQAFIAKLSPDGKWRWVASGGGLDSNDRCNSLDFDKEGRIYTGGFYRTPPTFGNYTLTYKNSSDAWIARLDDLEFGKGDIVPIQTPSDTVLCENDTVSMNIPDTSKLAYFIIQPQSNFTWINDKITFTALGTTTYTINLMSKDFCAEPDTIIFTIRGDTLPKASFTLTPDQTPHTNPTFTLTNNSQHVFAQVWYVNDSLIGNAWDYIMTMPDTGKYCFKLVTYNQEGCMDSMIKCGQIFKDVKVMVPSIFSPNSDQINSIFQPIYFNISPNEVTNFKFEIVDRFGSVVFKTFNPGTGWDGTYLNTKLPCDVGTYYYYLKYDTPYKKAQFIKGDVILMR